MTWIKLAHLFLVLSLLPGSFTGFCADCGQSPQSAQKPSDPYTSPMGPGIQGPFTPQQVSMHRFDGSLYDLARQPEVSGVDRAIPQPAKYTPNDRPRGIYAPTANWVDPVAQNSWVGELMPAPARNFRGISFAQGGAGWPPDTNGDIGPNYYIQTVNTSIAIFTATTGSQAAFLTFNQFFDGTGTSCDTFNSGDPVVVYDRFEDRWLISDFSLPSGGPYYECIAISQTGDPINGGWYMYAIPISDTAINDYPKVGVWRDGYYFSFNMFAEFSYAWQGVEVWAFEKTGLLAGDPNPKIVSFQIGADTGYASLLPGHALSLPPADAPNYFATVTAPNSLQIWEFKPDWANLPASTFSGPVELAVADFAVANSIHQPGTSILLDSLSPRPMMQLIYRAVNGVEALWMTHTVTSQGAAGMRWYEIRHPGAAPVLHQQGTYRPDANHRWMGSLAVDQDGNMALGYSVSSSSVYPSIRYTGRLAAETPGLLPQGESTIYAGTGSQSQSSGRWGDYSSMSVDPTDDCTFWYTTEYYTQTLGTNWQTRIAAFKYPSCGQPKGQIRGVVRNQVTGAPVPGVQVTASSDDQNMTVLTDNQGVYTVTLAADTFSLAAGPLLPGYPDQATASNVPLNAGATTSQDLWLAPQPYLVEGTTLVNDPVPQGNNNGYAEPGEAGIEILETLYNSGAVTSTQITARLESLTPGLTVQASQAAYPDIPAGQSKLSQTPFTCSASFSITCGTDLKFLKIITDSLKTYTITLTLNASVPLPPANVFTNTVESGTMGWVTGGTNNLWDITTSDAHSPSHSWSDSPAGNYADQSDSYLQTPIYNLSGKRNTQISFWARYNLEPGYDYVYLDYSLDGGATWSADTEALAMLNGVQSSWKQFTIATPALDGQSQLTLRFRLSSDSYTTADGIYLDDIILSYEPYVCQYGNHYYLPWVAKSP